MKETTFELFALMRAEQVINDIMNKEEVSGAPVPLAEDDPRFQSYFEDVEDLGSGIPPISPSAVFFEACEDKCLYMLERAKTHLNACEGIDDSPLCVRLGDAYLSLHRLNAGVEDQSLDDAYSAYANHLHECQMMEYLAHCELCTKQETSKSVAQV